MLSKREIWASTCFQLCPHQNSMYVPHFFTEGCFDMQLSRNRTSMVQLRFRSIVVESQGDSSFSLGTRY